MPYRVAVVGASGYTGAELLRYLSQHPELEPAIATSREFAGRPVRDVYPNLRVPLTYEELDPSRFESVDLVFLALPHTASIEIGTQLRKAGVAVVDLSADFRLHDADTYEQWYGKPHTRDALEGWVYGLPELHRDAIAGASAVANPGCYPTAALLALAPLLREAIVDPASIVISAASGVSGAGRGINAGVHFSHVDANLKAYGFPGHKHTPEIEQELASIAGRDVTVTFVPHLVPMPRGLLATCVATFLGGDPAAAAERAYAASPFVRILREQLPETKFTLGSNDCLLGYRVDTRAGRVIAVAAIDNLGKGAAGQAIQNANLMLGIDEAAGLGGGGLYP